MSSPDQNPMQAALDRTVDRLLQAARWKTIQIRVLGVVCVVLLVVVGVGAWNLQRVNHIATTVQNGAIAACQDGNKVRAANVKLWDEFLNILITNPVTPETHQTLTKEVAALDLPPATQQAFDLLINAEFENNPQSVKIVQTFEKYIAAHEAPDKCTQLYTASALR